MTRTTISNTTTAHTTQTAAMISRFRIFRLFIVNTSFLRGLQENRKKSLNILAEPREVSRQKMKIFLKFNK